MDYYRGVRMVVVLIWMLMNFVLVVVVLSMGGLDRVVEDDLGRIEEEFKVYKVNIYLQVVLWSVVGLSVFKFIGVLWFLIVRMFRGV